MIFKYMNTNKTLNVVVGVLIVVSISLVYFFYSARAFISPIYTDVVTNNLQVESSSGSCVYLDSDSNAIILENAYPVTDNVGYNSTPYEFTIGNYCSSESTANVYLVINSETDINLDAIRFYLDDGTSSVDGYLTEMVSYTFEEALISEYSDMTENEISAIYLLGEFDVQNNATLDMKLKLWIDYVAEVEEDKNLNATIVVGNDLGDPVPVYTLSQAILVNNGTDEYEDGTTKEIPADSLEAAVVHIEGKGTPTFNTTTDDEGMFATADDYGTSYYFRGAVDDNWVKFGQEDTDGDGEMEDIYWRIIRIDGEGNIRMIYSGTTAPTESTKVVMTGDGTQIDASTYNGDSSVTIEVDGTTYYMYKTLMGAQYVYTAGEIHGDSTPSVIKTVVDNWFVNDTNLSGSQFIATTTYCNDRTYYTSSSGTTLSTSVLINTSSTIYFGAYTRRVSSLPSLSCFSTDASIADALELEVALITADEVMFAGGSATANSSYYLYTNQSYWTLSPYLLTSGYAYVFNVYSSGYLYSSYVYSSYGVRPVVSLTSDISNFSGTGTYDDPYKIE